MRKPLLLAVAALSCATPLAGAALPATEIFPAEPGINAERGFAVAVDGNWLAMGAHREDRDIERDGIVEEKDAGAVYLFKWSGTSWDQKAKLLADSPQQGAHLGFALAMRDGVLAAGAPGEGAVYVFKRQDDDWAQEKRKLTGGVGTFGRSLALDDDRLAVGAFGAHGTPEGAVYLYDVTNWTCEEVVRPHGPQKGERFGAAVALADEVLVVGAPGYDTPADDAGAVYVFQFQSGPARWKEQAKLFPPGRRPQAGQQLGSAVATDGSWIFAGAPTADPHLEDIEAGEDGNNAGAVYGFVRDGGAWERQDLSDVEDLEPGDQFGASLALSGDFLVAGAPAAPPGRGAGRIHLFRRTGASWSEVRFPVAGNAEARDLAGFSVAVDDAPDDAPDVPRSKRVRVVVGGVLGDQGDGAAGASWSFLCSEEEEEEEKKCAEEAEAVARDTATGTFGVSVALTEKYLAVGSPAPPDDDSAGRVYLYRPAGLGWRQEGRLVSPGVSPEDPGFGAAVALDGDTLAVGAPRSPAFPNGAAYVFFHQQGTWGFFGDGFCLENPGPEERFGTSIAVQGDVLVIGAPRGSKAGAVYVWEKVQGDWEVTSFLTLSAVAHSANRFGASVSLFDKVLAIGAPEEGAVYVSARDGQGWSPRLVPVARLSGALGSSVAVGKDVLAAGEPDSGTVRIFEKTGSGGWTAGRLPSSPQPEEAPGFGASLSVLGNLLAVGAPDLEGSDLMRRQGRAFLFELGSESGRRFDLMPLDPRPGDEFGAAVAVSNRFLVVTSPGVSRGDRATVFTIPHGEVVDP